MSGFLGGIGGGGGSGTGVADDLTTSENDTTKLLQPDGSGGVVWNDGYDVVVEALSSANAEISVNNQKIINLLNPNDPQDAATKNYVDAIAQGLGLKVSSRVLSDSNETLSGLPTIDGITTNDGDRVLLVGQTEFTQIVVGFAPQTNPMI